MHNDPIDNIIRGERLPDLPSVRDLVAQASAWLDAGDRLGYDISIDAAHRTAGTFCYTCGNNGEVPGISGRPDETDACPDCNADNGAVPY